MFINVLLQVQQRPLNGFIYAVLRGLKEKLGQQVPQDQRGQQVQLEQQDHRDRRDQPDRLGHRDRLGKTEAELE